MTTDPIESRPVTVTVMVTPQVNTCRTRVTVSFVITDQARMLAEDIFTGDDFDAWIHRISQGAERGLVAAIQDSLPEGLRVRVDEDGIRLIGAWPENDL